MSNHRIKMRLSGTKEDLEKWLWFVGKMDFLFFINFSLVTTSALNFWKGGIDIAWRLFWV